MKLGIMNKNAINESLDYVGEVCQRSLKKGEKVKIISSIELVSDRTGSSEPVCHEVEALSDGERFLIYKDAVTLCDK